MPKLGMGKSTALQVDLRLRPRPREREIIQAQLKDYDTIPLGNDIGLENPLHV